MNFILSISFIGSPQFPKQVLPATSSVPHILEEGGEERKEKRRQSGCGEWAGVCPQLLLRTPVGAPATPLNLALALKPTLNSRPLLTTTNAGPGSPQEAADWPEPRLPR